ncbi:MAG TPA: hypothetical protein VII02_04055 [Gemmatimonadaceae bacterium]
MNRLGVWSASALFIVGVVYAGVVALGIHASGFSAPIVDPVLAVMEALTLLSAPLLVLVMIAVHRSASSADKPYALAALAFVVIASGLTSAVHFVGLTALRQSGSGEIVWPSPQYAIELLAWDVFLGLSLLFGALTFRGGGLRRAIRISSIATGTLCLLGTLGPATGEMRLQFIAVVGYGIGLPVTCLLLARIFRRAPVGSDGEVVISH